MYYGQALCVEGDGAVGKWFARSVFKIAQYGVAYVRELYAYLMMASGGEVHAHRGYAFVVCQSFVGEFCALSVRGVYDAAFCLPPRDVVYEMPAFGDFAVDESDIAFFYGSLSKLLR